jgi:hypothetical protein
MSSVPTARRVAGAPRRLLRRAASDATPPPAVQPRARPAADQATALLKPRDESKGKEQAHYVFVREGHHSLFPFLLFSFDICSNMCVIVFLITTYIISNIFNNLYT